MSRRPRLGFLGAGWIGRSRLRAVAASGRADIVAVADPELQALTECATIVPGAALLTSFDELLELSLDGVVIATPSAQHATQCERALERGLAVFCQKPLGRTAVEVESVMAAAERVDRPLGVDFSYRETAAFRALCGAIADGTLGRPYAVDSVFHNAYGPDKSWAYEQALSGGGCLLDLGVHLLDAAASLLPESEPVALASSLHAGGRPLSLPTREVEDSAFAQLNFAGGAVVRLACSWRSSYGTDASIRIVCTGTRASAAFENVDGSFYDFRCTVFHGKERTELAHPPDAWEGRTLLVWLGALERGAGYDEDWRLSRVAHQLELLYGRERVGTSERLRASDLGARA